MAELAASRQLEDLLWGQFHPVHVPRVVTSARNERLVVLGSGLETAVAAEYFLHWSLANER